MQVETLKQDPSYKLLLTLRHNNLLPFIQQYVFTYTITMLLFWVLNSVLLFWMGWRFFLDSTSEFMSWVGLLKAFGIALLLLLTLFIIIHEAIHGIAYKLVGAPKVSYGMNLSEFYFYAIADGFVIARKAFVFVALAPFIVISAGLIVGLVFGPSEWKWILYGLLFFHTGACAGDFGILSFYEKNKGYNELLTFDDLKEGLSYFYAR